MKIYKEQYFNSLTGYKISNSHFELGSNLHINDYYYAKRLFYNSFYTNRFAFLIVNYILKEFNVLIKELCENREENLPNSDNTITLLGFDNYSELLISNVRKMLNDYMISNGRKYTSELFNHEIFTKESLFLKNPDKVGNNIISIFPISTTLSTTVKVQNDVKSILKRDYYKDSIIFHNPTINFILIANDALKKDKEFSQNDKESEYGWLNYKQIERKVDVTNLDDSTIISQVFFINLITKWEKINSCKSCYPVKKSEEKCLIETKSSPVTPDLIFSYPKTYCYDGQDIYGYFKAKGESPIVYRKHFKRYNNNFIYYIKAGIFLKQNKPSILEWLSKIRNELNIKIDQNIVIVTPSIGANSGFVNLVNDSIFSDTATIIQYNPTEDYLYNFKKFYSEIISSADSVIFVDDILFSTNTFNDINFYIKSIKRNVGTGVDRCISLINRAGYYNYNKLIENLPSGELKNEKSIFSFVDINVAPLLHRKTYPFEKLKRKFKELSEKSVLDEMRLHFEKKEMQFAAIDLAKDNKNIERFGSPKALFQFLVFNELNSLFSFDSEKKEYSNKELLENCFEYKNASSYKPIENLLYENESISGFLRDYPSFKYEVKNLIYKIFSSEPFIQFKNIKLTVFDWVLCDLVKIVDEITSTDDIKEDFFQAKKHNKPIEYSQFQEYKFLLKRAIKLKMNYVYSRDVMLANEKVLKGIKQFKKINKYILEPKKENVIYNPKNLFDAKDVDVFNLVEDTSANKYITTNGFITYYVGLLQELIIDHEAKALQTVMNVKEIIDLKQSLFSEANINLKNTYNDDFMILLRRLVLENTFIFHTSSNRFINKLEKKLSFEDLKNNTELDSFKKNLENDYGKYSFDYTKKMLSAFKPNDKKDEEEKFDFVNDDKMFDSFKYMLMLKSALIDDLDNTNSSKLSVQNKIELILKYCCQLLDIKEGGAFFAVKYKNRESEITHEDDIAIVGEFHNNSNKIIKSSDINKNSIVYNMFNGIKRDGGKYSLSCFELSLDENNQYQYLNNDKINNENLKTFIEVEDEKFKNLFYLKISEIDILNDEKLEIYPKAVICFYDNIEKGKYDFIRFDPKRVRQLLLLRNDINDFINHHLYNDGLRAYIEELKNNKFQFVLNHGISIYRDTFEINLDKLLDGINSKDQDTIRKERGYLETINRYITNKLSLLSQAKRDVVVDQTYSLESLVEIFTVNVNNILFFDHANIYYEKLNDSNQLIFNADVEREGSFKLSFPSSFIDEVVFELVYNIRKHAINGNEITKENPLTISLQIFDIIDANQFKISLTNNHVDEDATKRNFTSYQQRGLNLIYTIMKKINLNNEISVSLDSNTYKIILNFDNNRDNAKNNDNRE